jgi:hypothetical protein
MRPNVSGSFEINPQRHSRSHFLGMMDVWLYNTFSSYLTDKNIVCSVEKYYYVYAVSVNGCSLHCDIDMGHKYFGNSASRVFGQFGRNTQEQLSMELLR